MRIPCPRSFPATVGTRPPQRSFDRRRYSRGLILLRTRWPSRLHPRASPRNETGSRRLCRRGETPGTASRADDASGAAPGGRSKMSPCQWNGVIVAGKPRIRRSSLARSCRRIGCQPISLPAGLRSTFAPSAAARICAPRHTPSIGRFDFIASSIRRILVAQPRIAVGLIDAHRPAHDDEAAGPLHVRGHGLAVVNAHVLPGERGALERVGDGAEVLDRVMLEDVNLRHRR